MAKFANLFGDKTFWITNTYHTENGNRAIDGNIGIFTSPLTPVYAVGDGPVLLTNTHDGSYLAQNLTDSNIRFLYVHTARWVVKAGDFLKKGQKLGYVASQKENGGYPLHVHPGLQWKRGSGYPNLMDYMDRSIVYKTKFKSIEDLWFKNGTINWGLFKDKSYLTTENKPQYKIGDRLFFTDTMNLRTYGGDLIPGGNIAKGAVGQLHSAGSWREIEGVKYWIYDIRFSNEKGFVADTTRNEVTEKPVTNIDGTKPVEPCDELKKENEELREALVASEAKVELLKTQLTQSEMNNDILREKIKAYTSALDDLQKVS